MRQQKPRPDARLSIPEAVRVIVPDGAGKLRFQTISGFLSYTRISRREKLAPHTTRSPAARRHFARSRVNFRQKRPRKSDLGANIFQTKTRATDVLAVICSNTKNARPDGSDALRGSTNAGIGRRYDAAEDSISTAYRGLAPSF